MMFLCLPIIFIISISEIRSDRSFSTASAEHNHTGNVSYAGRARLSQPTLSLTFEHLHGHLGDSGGLVPVDACGLSQDHLTETALAQRFAQGQPVDHTVPLHLR